MKGFWKSALLGFFLAVWSFVPSAHALVFEVTRTDDPPPDGCDSGNDCSLREAILAANANDGDDAISLQGAIYRLTRSGADEDAADTGDLDIDDGGNATTISGVGADSTIIDASGLGDRILDVPNSAGQTVNLADLTLQNGDAGGADGGAIAVSRSSGGNLLNISDCKILDNQARDGGAIWGQNHGNQGLVLLRSLVQGNIASRDGGGLWTRSGFSPSLVDSALDDNEAGGDGGGGYIRENNSMEIRNSTVSNNTAAGNGGGLWLDSMTADQGFLPFLVNSTLSENHAGNKGGGLRLGALSLNVHNVTLTRNGSTAQGAGVYVEFEVGSVEVANSIIAGNDSNFLGADCFEEEEASQTPPNVSSLGYNLFGDVSACSLFLGPEDQAGLGFSALGLGVLADNGGPTLTHALMEGSPAQDAGDPSGCLDAEGMELSADQRGETRPGGSRCDVGAFELQEQAPGNGGGDEGEAGGGDDDGDSGGQEDAEGGGCSLAGSGAAEGVCWMLAFAAVLMFRVRGSDANRGIPKNRPPGI